VVAAVVADVVPGVVGGVVAVVVGVVTSVGVGDPWRAVGLALPVGRPSGPPVSLSAGSSPGLSGLPPGGFVGFAVA
jgi:hypothetical protein